jgi:hypothetical protein
LKLIKIDKNPLVFPIPPTGGDAHEQMSIFPQTATFFTDSLRKTLLFTFYFQKFHQEGVYKTERI